MRGILLITFALGCTKGSPEPQRDVLVTPAPKPALSPQGPFASLRGPVVTETGVMLDGHALADPPTAAELRGLPVDHVALAFTDDAPVSRVLGVAAALFATGHVQVDFTALVAGAPKLVCQTTAAPPNATAVELAFAKGGVEVSFENAIPVFGHAQVADAPLVAELGAPFFATADALALASDAATPGAALVTTLVAVCTKPRAIHILLERPPPSVMSLPLCRKLVAKGSYDTDKLREAMPSLYAMDLCYRTFEPHQGPRGTATMTFDLEPDGTLVNPVVTGLHQDTDRCIAYVVGTAKLASPPPARTHMRATMECNTRCCNGD
jgi:hypothetical protein